MTLQELRSRADQLRAVPLEAVLALAGAERDRYDRAKWHTVRGTLSVTGAKFMNWNRGAGGGGAIDLVIHLMDLRFEAAIEWLCRHFPCSAPSGPVPPPPKPALRLPPQDVGQLSRVRQYLVQDRRLAPSVIEALVQSGRLYADARGNAVFVLLGKENRAVGAELRGTTPSPWRGMAPGSRKDLGYFSVSMPGTRRIVLCESAIDAVSCFILGHGSLCISTAGARPNPLWLAPLVRGADEIYCGFDADPTGDEMARAMIALHPRVQRLRPALKDWNDVLRANS